MKRIKRKYFLITAVVILIAVIAICIWQFRITHPTHPKFNDKFILGSTAEEIIDRYGDFYVYSSQESITGEITATGIYKAQEKISSWIFYRSDAYYYIHFDKDGKAFKVYLEEGWPGG